MQTTFSSITSVSSSSSKCYHLHSVAIHGEQVCNGDIKTLHHSTHYTHDSVAAPPLFQSACPCTAASINPALIPSLAQHLASPCPPIQWATAVTLFGRRLIGPADDWLGVAVRVPGGSGLWWET
ncbi:hypothetical protein P153DRAFT_11802 [Dothidotthia symphoricarpi CBS 119687]|uniref:Uncharacterized protein n=1 Tax=Dothidotthia symphoricarpi CBS 119687 TaxID=1392245 RepID=A0A6A6ASB1_9PLEO|nr:uncharacterized protein P153DRAFT_11802 [Dothidotthia symphoricarpi CBS 119687]KAF2134882.1 hypothetical protein P153DRAFT_11802 [Dothidotthia symphoricarpi CBS 119687]